MLFDITTDSRTKADLYIKCSLSSKLKNSTTTDENTVISIGFCKIFRANASIVRGNVALNKTVCRSGRTFCMIFVICGSKPASNIRSASSRTMYVTRRRFVTFPASRRKLVYIFAIVFDRQNL
jgi:hypothetical protein